MTQRGEMSATAIRAALASAAAFAVLATGCGDGGDVHRNDAELAEARFEVAALGVELG